MRGYFIYGLNLGIILTCTSNNDKVCAAVATNPATACLTHKFGCTRKQAVSAINSLRAKVFRSPSSPKEPMAFMAFAVTNSEESVKP